MKKILLLMTTCLISACAGEYAPPPPVSLVAATPVDPITLAVEPSADALSRPIAVTPTNPLPEPKVKNWKSAEAKIAAANKASLRTALDGEYEGAILRYEYRRGGRYRVVVDGPSDQFPDEPGWGIDADATTITLGQDDGSEPNITVGGDPQWFNVDKVGTGVEKTMREKRDQVRAMAQGVYTTQITIKCHKRGARATATIGTGKRNYIFDLQCANTHGRNNYNHSVEFYYADEQQVSFPQPVRTTPASAAPVVADIRYEIDGPAEWRPREWTAWNDGAKTYVHPSPSVQSRPVPMLPAGAGFFIDPMTSDYVITGLPGEILFPWGEQAITVRRRP